MIHLPEPFSTIVKGILASIVFGLALKLLKIIDEIFV